MPTLQIPNPKSKMKVTAKRIARSKRYTTADTMQRMARRESQADLLLTRSNELIRLLCMQIRGGDVEAPLPLDVQWLRKDIAAWRDE